MVGETKTKTLQTSEELIVYPEVPYFPLLSACTVWVVGQTIHGRRNTQSAQLSVISKDHGASAFRELNVFCILVVSNNPGSKKGCKKQSGSI